MISSEIVIRLRLTRTTDLQMHPSTCFSCCRSVSVGVSGYPAPMLPRTRMN